MRILNRYLLKMLTKPFLSSLFGLIGVIWVTQSLRQFTLVTTQGQSFLTFLKVTTLALPSILTILAPVALFIAVLQTFNRLNADSELVMFSTIGVSHWQILKPLFGFSLVVALFTLFLTGWIMPESSRTLRDIITQIRADFVSKIIQSGKFNTLERNVVFHYREKSGDALVGVFIQDSRDPQLTIAYIAERGQVVESGESTYLVLETGSVQRESARAVDASVVAFKRYSLDLAQLTPDAADVKYSPRERSTSDLVKSVVAAGRMTIENGHALSELVERLVAPLYTLAFMAIGFAATVTPRTTRQSGTRIVLFAIGTAIGIRLIGFAIGTMIARNPELSVASVLMPLLAIFSPFLYLHMKSKIGGSRGVLSAERN
ncbi:MAG: LPS export ABC transporter permease LptF [Hyphomicrobiales bacterium]